MKVGMPGRRDLRETRRVFSVDPKGCTDIDDAMSVFGVVALLLCCWSSSLYSHLSLPELASGMWEVGVHIADVDVFMPHNSPLDIEARARATSVYLVDRKINMIPEVALKLSSTGYSFVS